ncbi:MAG: hypothetical protein JRI23_03125 [Deltaproteobacteria bacterium]|jgi:hypothetical protein|nr:hypothetical protein [Deltaproteobacteria bacterium]MBW2530501.1 hypothetical protein [Deltaproteobacteria bacterium]
MKRASILLLVSLALGCGAAAPGTSPAGGPVATVGPGGKGAPGAPADPFAVIGALTRERLPDEPPGMPLRRLPFPPVPQGVPAMPQHCEVYAARRPAGSVECSDRASALAALDQALQRSDPHERDTALVDVESCQDLPLGLVRALRAELAPTECGDGVVEQLLSNTPDQIGGMVYDALFGLGLAGRLARTVTSPPKLTPPYDKKRVKAFHEGPLLAWGTEQAQAIQGMSDLGVKLGYYGKAVVAVEAGMADMRFVEMVRGLPVPDEYREDKELLDQYYGGLDVALEPRKSRGRDAALVGLRGLAYVGVITDPRVGKARGLLSRMYGGRPIDALDALLLPVEPPAPAATVEQRLARALPSFYAGLVLVPAAVDDALLLRALTRRGLPLPHRIALAKAEPSPEIRLIAARARFELGRTYWRAVDIDESVHLLSQWPQGSPRPPEATLLLALGLALRGGPADAAAMIRTAPVESLGIGRVAALEAVAKDEAQRTVAGQAEFDAAVILELAAPPRAEAGYWQDLARRFRAAAGGLTDPKARAEAEQRARAATATARAIR